MSEIERFTWHDCGLMIRSKDGAWVRYEDHRAEIERLIAERDKAQAGDDVALSALTSVLRDRDAAEAEIERLRAQLTEAHERCGALELSIEQADELKAHAEASAAAEEAETDRVTAERDAAQAEVKRLIGERVAAQAEFKRLIDRLAWAEARVDEDAETGRIAAERDAARAEVERLRAEVERLQANGQAMLDTSRPSDEDIWREAFFRAWEGTTLKQQTEQADLALTEYRKRWPR